MPRYDNYNPEIPDSDNDTLSFGEESQVRPSVKTRRNRNSVRTASKSPLDKESRQRKGEKEVREKTASTSIFSRIQDFFTSQSFKSVSGILFVLIAAYLVVAFISFLKEGFADQSLVENLSVGNASGIRNAAGEGGARITQFLVNDCFGLGSVVIIIWLVMIGLKLMAGKSFIKFKTVNFSIKCIVALITLSLIVGLLTIGLESHVNWGGNHGRYLNQWIINFFGWIGGVMLCLFMIVVFVAICMRDVVKWAMKKKRERDERRAKEAELRALKEARRKEIEDMERQEILDSVKANEHADVEAENETAADTPDVEFSGDDLLTYIDDDTEKEKETETKTKSDAELPVEELHGDVSDSEDLSVADSSVEAGENGMRVNVNHIGEAADPDEAFENLDPRRSLPNFQFPPYALLRPAGQQVSVNPEEQNQNRDKIKNTLLDFGIPIKSIEATVGPTVTLYEIVPENGVKISRIKSLSEDIAMRLNASGVRIIAPIPMRGTVGIEVPNLKPQTVSMRTVITSRRYQESKCELPLALGSTISNEVYLTDLTRMPHLLVAGATGQGKSVGLNVIILSLLYRKHPSELKFVMIDPKMVELSMYEPLRNHYLAQLPGETEPIITDMKKVVPTLSALCAEMEERYQLLKDAIGVKDIVHYNEKFLSGKLNPSLGHRYMPYIVLVVDEFADLMMTAGKEVEKPIIRLAQKARAVGIHLILATQRPSTDVITGLIKANFPSRIAFKTSSGIDSKTILNTTTAEKLIGRGDMLISNNSDLVRVQCAFADTPEVEDVCSFIAGQEGEDGPYILPEPVLGNDNESDMDSSHGIISGGTFGDRDPLFDSVAKLVVTSGHGSTSAIQRRFSIGYNRAGKIMDQLEAAGVVGPATGGKVRQVLVDESTLASILGN